MKLAPLFPIPSSSEHERCTYVGGPWPKPLEGSASSDSGSQLPHSGLWGATDTPCWRRREVNLVAREAGQPGWLRRLRDSTHWCWVGHLQWWRTNQQLRRAAASVAGQRCRVKVFLIFPVSFLKQTDGCSSELRSFDQFGSAAVAWTLYWATHPDWGEPWHHPSALGWLNLWESRPYWGSCYGFPICWGKSSNIYSLSALCVERSWEVFANACT